MIEREIKLPWGVQRVRYTLKVHPILSRPVADALEVRTDTGWIKTANPRVGRMLDGILAQEWSERRWKADIAPLWFEHGWTARVRILCRATQAGKLPPKDFARVHRAIVRRFKAAARMEASRLKSHPQRFSLLGTQDRVAIRLRDPLGDRVGKPARSSVHKHRLDDEHERRIKSD